MRRRAVFYGLIILLAPMVSRAQAVDTAAELHKLVSAFKNLKNMGCDYVMGASFPNGDKDNLSGTMYMNNDEGRYYNDCNAFVMICSPHWLYKADHRKKTVTIANLDKGDNRQLKKKTEQDIFKNDAITIFLDSFVLKTAIIRSIKQDGELVKIALGFPDWDIVQRFECVYNTATGVPVSYDMTVDRPWQQTPKGIQVMRTTIKCSNFKKADDKSRYGESNFFTDNNGKIELKKYNNYKLSGKM